MRTPLPLTALVGLAFAATACGRTSIFDPVGSSFGEVGGDAGDDEGNDEEGNDEWAEEDEGEVDTGAWDEGGEGGEVCPEPGQIGPVEFWVENEAPIPPGANLPCQIVESFSEYEFTEVAMICRGPNFETFVHIFLEHAFGAWVPISPGMDVIFQHHREWPNEWFALHWPQPELGLIVGGVKAEWTYSPFGTVAYDPLFVNLVERDCPLDEAECGLRRSLALDAEFQGSAIEIWPGSVGWLGEFVGYQVAVDQAHMYEELWCDDVPKQWLQAMFIAITEG